MNFNEAFRRARFSIVFRVWDFGMKKNLIDLVYYTALINLYFV